MSALPPDDPARRVFAFAATLPAGVAAASALQALRQLDDAGLQALLDLNRQRLTVLGGVLASDPAPAASTAASDAAPLQRRPWQWRYGASSLGAPRVEFCGELERAAALDLFVDAVLVHRFRAGPGRFSLPIHSALKLRPGAEIVLAHAGQPLAGIGGAELQVVPSADDGSDASTPLDLAAAARAGHFRNKKAHLAPLAFAEQQRKQDYMAHYRAVAEVFGSVVGRELFVSHGTLLGLVRQHDLIASDDDFDCAYLSPHHDVAEVAAERDRVFAALKQARLAVAASITGHIQVHDRARRVMLDIMPAWHDGAHFNVSSFTSVALPLAAIVPLQQRRFLDTPAWLPADPEAFLAANYGPGWRTPDPGFHYHIDARCAAHRRVLAPDAPPR